MKNKFLVSDLESHLKAVSNLAVTWEKSTEDIWIIYLGDGDEYAVSRDEFPTKLSALVYTKKIIDDMIKYEFQKQVWEQEYREAQQLEAKPFLNKTVL